MCGCQTIVKLRNARRRFENWRQSGQAANGREILEAMGLTVRSAHESDWLGPVVWPPQEYYDPPFFEWGSMGLATMALPRG